MLTLIIDKCVRKWADLVDLLPASQNGFREGYRTHNNSFILQAAIEQVRAEGKPLYVAFIDLKKAFPSTDLPTLWLKLSQSGLVGPIFDWIRMLYAQMSYVVRHRKEVSSAFCSMVGLLTGDTLLPMLWNLYFTDLNIPDHKDNIALYGIRVSHVKQADDVAMWSTSPEALQIKLDAFFKWCSLNLMTVSVKKTKWMLFGPIRSCTPSFTINGESIEWVDQYKYVGVLFTSTARNIFASFYPSKAGKARNVTQAIFAMELLMGCIPPKEGITLYWA